MLHLFERRPDLKAAHIFADHLEATLDLAEELELLHLILPESDATAETDVLAGLDRIGAFIERIEVIELAIAAKLDLARAAARRIADRDARLSTFSKLFHSGTQPLVDLYPALADPGGRIFDSGHDPLTFLQARGTIDESRCTLEDQRFLGTGDDYLLLGTVRLGAFIELCDTCLKAIDRHYHLYDDDAAWEADRTSTLETLRARRDEAIRRALGAQAPVIEAPVEIMPPDAVDEAIELIEGLTFPEEQRFHPEPQESAAHPAQEDETPVELAPDAMDDVPYELPADAVEAAAETVFEAEAPIELPVDAVEIAAETVVEVEAETAVEIEESAQAIVGLANEAPEETFSLEADAIVVEPEVSAIVTADLVSDPQSAAEPKLELACPAETPAIKPRLLAPLASARKSLIAFLTRRRSDPIESGETTVADETEAAVVEAAIETISITAVLDTPEDVVAITAARQRLVDLIALRTRLPSEQAPALDVEAARNPDETVCATLEHEPVVAGVAVDPPEAPTPSDSAESAAETAEAPSVQASDEPSDLDVANTPADAIAEDVEPQTAPRKRRNSKGRVKRRRRAKKTRDG